MSSNSDPKSIGRVQVQFDWQKRMSKNTNWIQVQSPDAGGSGMKNRGMVFVPEVGDQVMVGFEYGDPSRPYVMGSLFGGKTGNGGGSGNNTRSIFTKSGHRLVFSDDKGGGWSILLADDNGNSIELSTSQKTILIKSLEEIKLMSKNITLKADEQITQTSGKDFEVSVGGSFTQKVEKDSSVSVKGKSEETVEKDSKRTINGQSDVSVAKDCKTSVSGKLNLSVDKDAKLEFGGKLK